MRKREAPIVRVMWYDSEASSDWTPVGEAASELEVTTSAGYLIRRTRNFILLALSYDRATDSINAFKKIPRAAIIEILTVWQPPKS